MIASLIMELELRKDYLPNKEVQTVYFGGGTPSILPTNQLGIIIDKIFSIFPGPKSEITLEANPDDLNPSKLNEWKSMGIDRLSLGIQSFQAEILRAYNRSHTAQESKKAIEIGRKAGFDKFSIDLIYGYPYRDHSIWKKDLQEAFQIDPGHISAYSLTIEPKTAFGNWTQKGSFKPADEEFIAEQFEFLQAKADISGYIQYEISNFGRPGKFALHNSNYWLGQPYLGIGPSAHSFNGTNRGFNPPSNTKYTKTINLGITPFVLEPMGHTDHINELILTRLRTIWGLDTESLKQKFGTDLMETKNHKIASLESHGLLKVNGKILSLTRKGQLLADGIAAELFI
jgi:oxygen-independent coproporphyrinogen III oxidase